MSLGGSCVQCLLGTSPSSLCSVWVVGPASSFFALKCLREGMCDVTACAMRSASESMSTCYVFFGCRHTPPRGVPWGSPGGSRGVPRGVPWGAPLGVPWGGPWGGPWGSPGVWGPPGGPQGTPGKPQGTPPGTPSDPLGTPRGAPLGTPWGPPGEPPGDIPVGACLVVCSGDNSGVLGVI